MDNGSEPELEQLFAASARNEPQVKASDDSPAEDPPLAAAMGVRPFHNPRPPTKALQKERAQHRLCAYLFCTGLSQTEIAKRMGWAIPTVSNLWRQPWFQEFIKEEMAGASRDTLNDVIKGAAVDSVFTLITLRDEKSTPAGVKRQCCSELLDRAMGKAPQTVHNVGYAGGDVADIQRVDEDLKAMLDDKALMQSLQPSLS